MSRTRSKQIRRFAARTYRPGEVKNAARRIRREYDRVPESVRREMREQME